MLPQIVGLLVVLPLQMGDPPGGGGAGPGGSSGGGDFVLGTPLPPDTFMLTALEGQVAAPPGGAAFVRFDLHQDKTQSLVIRAFGLPDGTYDVVRTNSEGASAVGSFKVESDGMGKLSAEPPPVDDFLDWYLNFNTIDVRDGADVLFSAMLDSPTTFILLGGPAHSMVNGARLIAVGEDLDARGRLVFSVDPPNEQLNLRLERVAPGPYIVEIDGKPQLYLDAGPGGKASLRLTRPAESGTGLLPAWLSTVSKDVRVLDAAGAIVLSARTPFDPHYDLRRPPSRQKFHDVGDGAADGLQVDFIRQGGDFSGFIKRSSAAWQRDALGQATITVELEGKLVTGLPYELFVGDTWIGDLAVPSGAGNDPFTGSLVVDPGLDLRGQRVEIRMLDTEPLALYFPQSVPAGLRAYHKDLRKPHHLRLDLLNPGIDLDATGLVDWRLKAGVETLRLVVRDLPAGAYDVVLDGSVVAAGALVVDEVGGEDEELFSTASVPGESLPLDFAVHGALEIRAAGTSTTYLQQDLGD